MKIKLAEAKAGSAIHEAAHQALDEGFEAFMFNDHLFHTYVAMDEMYSYKSLSIADLIRLQRVGVRSLDA